MLEKIFRVDRDFLLLLLLLLFLFLYIFYVELYHNNQIYLDFALILHKILLSLFGYP